MSKAYPAVFMRGGTSKAVMFQARHLPQDRAVWDPLFLAVMGSPDPFGRQLDGMGGGISSLSKVCVIAPSERPDADVDYTFAQVQIREARVDYRANCGNMSSAVGPFAIDEGIVVAKGDSATVRIFNTNTQRLIHSTFALAEGRALYRGDCAIPGVAGRGAPIRLDFLEPGGAITGRLLPCGSALTRLAVSGHGTIEASLVDAANAVVFVRARDLGLEGTELPAELERDTAMLAKLDAVRIAASLAMGLTPNEAAARKSAMPFIAFVSPPRAAPTLTGETLAPDAVDLTVRFLSSGQPHRALPLTGALCTAVAAAIPGVVVAEMLPRPPEPGALIRLGMPSGVLGVGADVVASADGFQARSGSFLRTARRLFDGRVWVG